MAAVEGIVSNYHCQMRTEEERVKVKPNDLLKIDATISVRYSNNLYVIETSTLLKRSISISCQGFFENNQDFLRSLMFDPRCSNCFIPETVDLISEKIVSMIKVISEFCRDPESVDSESKELSLNLDIIVDVIPDEDSDEEEEEMEENAMIPASGEAIDSLETFTDLSFLETKTESCNICMENFGLRENEENVKLSSMPCNHVFHHLCIVKWLQISHTCPLCRYPMPIHKN